MAPDQLLFQRLPRHVRHDNKWLAVLLPDLKDAANVGVVEGGSRAGFAPETLNGFRALSRFLRQELQCYDAAQARVLGLVHYTHPSTTYFFQNAIVGNRAADNVRACFWRDRQRSLLLGQRLRRHFQCWRLQELLRTFLLGEQRLHLLPKRVIPTTGFF